MLTTYRVKVLLVVEGDEFLQNTATVEDYVTNSLWGDGLTDVAVSEVELIGKTPSPPTLRRRLLNAIDGQSTDEQLVDYATELGVDLSSWE